MPTEICYDTVARAIEMYRDLGYREVEAPWLVDHRAIAVTLPAGRRGFALSPAIEGQPDRLVGSAEQGFVQMMLDGTLKPGRYVAAGPCFRDEPIVDEHHQLSFFKVELIDLARPDEVDVYLENEHRFVSMMAEQAKNTIASLYSCRPGLKIVTTPEGCDLTLGGVEIGSYGPRRMGDVVWFYGTGLALPRTPRALRVAERQHQASRG